jgi:hypothetical protein
MATLFCSYFCSVHTEPIKRYLRRLERLAMLE